MNETNQLTDSIRVLPGVGPVVEQALSNLGIRTINDLLEFLPFRLEDRSRIVPIDQLRPNEDVVIRVTVDKATTRKSQRGITIIQATAFDQSGKIAALWFNQRYILKFLQPGRQLLLYGTKRLSKPLNHPFFVKAIISETGWIPIYHTTRGINQATIRRLLRQARPSLASMETIIPETVCQQLQLGKRQELLEQTHFEASEDLLDAAHTHLSFEELLLLALAIRQEKAGQERQQITPLAIDTGILKDFVASLPFQLTEGQRRAAWEIIQELGKPQPMNRILYGEVGSGKTAVALLASLATIKAGRKVVFLSPTTTLASQQAAVASRLLKPMGISVGLWMGSIKENFEADLLIGTHALLHKELELANVGLLIIDEQHRFGVNQRQALLLDHPETHLLMMTATPIPRSLAQTIFGHLSISYLAGKPAHQQPIETKIFTSSQRQTVEMEIKQRLDRDEPGYVICPLIDPAEQEELQSLFTTERKAILSEEKRLHEVFPQAKIGVLHGRLKIAEKEAVMADFRSGGLDILLSTTVVEVGIDNPQATWILIEDAQRFGLSQLHQLRGRVGRGSKASVCYLAADTTDNPRLQALVQSANGLELAEYDLAIRGPGDLIGYDQSGLPKLRFAAWSDQQLIKEVFTLAEKLVNDGLEKYPNLEKRLKEFIESRHELSAV